jgi:hypothetical protein
MRLLVTLAGLAIGFAVPVLAQEQNTVDPEVRQQIEATMAKQDEAFNKNDAAGCTADYTQDAVEVWEMGDGGWRSCRSRSHREKGCSHAGVKSG